MGHAKPNRRWWRKKRWWAAGVLWFATLWAASAGPAGWAVNRGWLPPGVYQTCFLPAVLVIRETPARSAYRDYMFLWTPFGPSEKESYDALWKTAEEEAASDTETVAADTEIVRKHWTPPKAEP